MDEGDKGLHEEADSTHEQTKLGTEKAEMLRLEHHHVRIRDMLLTREKLSRKCRDVMLVEVGKDQMNTEQGVPERNG